MIVIDASAMVAALVGHEVDDNLLELLAGEIAAPHLLDVEVMSALRGLEHGGQLDPELAGQAMTTYLSFGISRHEMAPLARRMWQLRHQFTSYDASYLALAEALGVQLVTCDSKLASDGHRATVTVVAGAS